MNTGVPTISEHGWTKSGKVVWSTAIFPANVVEIITQEGTGADGGDSIYESEDEA